MGGRVKGIIGKSCNTVNYGLFSYNVLNINGFNLDKVDEVIGYEEKYRRLNSSIYVGGSTFGESRVYANVVFKYLNRTYPLVTKKTGEEKVIVIDKGDFLNIFFNDPNIVLKPAILVNKLLSLIDPFLDIKVYSANSDYDEIGFIKDITLNQKSVSNFLSTNIFTLNISSIISSLYSGLNLMFVQEGVMPDGNICMYTPLDLANTPIIKHGGVLSIKDAIDYTKVKEIMTYTIGDDGSISGKNPFDGSETYEKWITNAKIETLSNSVFNSSMALGSEYNLSLYIPLLMFFNNVKASHDKEIEVDTKDVKIFPKDNLYADVNLEKNTKENQKEFNGKKKLKALIKEFNQFFNPMYAQTIPITVLGEIPKMSKIKINISLPIEKFDKDKFDFEENGELDISADLLVVNSNVQYILTRDGIIAVSNVNCVDLKDSFKYDFLSKKPTDPDKRPTDPGERTTDPESDIDPKILLEKISKETLQQVDELEMCLMPIDNSIVDDLFNDYTEYDPIGFTPINPDYKKYEPSKKLQNKTIETEPVIDIFKLDDIDIPIIDTPPIEPPSEPPSTPPSGPDSPFSF